MKINEKKSKVMIFNTRKKYDARPKLAVGDSEYLEVIEPYKLLGVIVNNCLNFKNHLFGNDDDIWQVYQAGED